MREETEMGGQESENRREKEKKERRVIGRQAGSEGGRGIMDTDTKQDSSSWTLTYVVIESPN